MVTNMKKPNMKELWVVAPAAVALVGTGVVLVLTGGDDGSPASRQAFAPILGPQTWGGTYSLEF